MATIKFKEFVRTARSRLDLSQAELAARITDYGQETSAARVGHWETGRNKPPLDDEGFRLALAAALEMDVNDLMEQLGFVVNDHQRSRQALRAADMIDQLPDEVRDIAVELIDVLAKRYRME